VVAWNGRQVIRRFDWEFRGFHGVCHGAFGWVEVDGRPDGLDAWPDTLDGPPPPTGLAEEFEGNFVRGVRPMLKSLEPFRSRTCSKAVLDRLTHSCDLSTRSVKDRLFRIQCAL